MAFTIFQDEDYLAISKPTGVHFDDPSLMQSVRNDFWKPVHRIDQETSGLLLFAREALVLPTRALFQNPDSSLRKIYLAGLSHHPDVAPQHEVQGWIGSRYRSSARVQFVLDTTKLRGYRNVRPARHRVRKLGRADRPEGIPFGEALYEVELLTGARHQIRAYFAALGCPLNGDAVYNPKAKVGERLELHAWKLQFTHPNHPKKRYEFEAPF